MTSTGTARERILDAASDLFYREGIRAVGIDAIVAQSGVAKMTLYRHFASKDDLIVAFLEQQNARHWRWFEAAVGETDMAPRTRIQKLFTALAEKVRRPTYRGCPFNNTSTEFPGPDHPGWTIVREHKRRLRDEFMALAIAGQVGDPAALVDDLLLLMDGAYMSAQTLGPDGPAAHVAEAAARVLNGHFSTSPP